MSSAGTNKIGIPSELRPVYRHAQGSSRNRFFSALNSPFAEVLLLVLLTVAVRLPWIFMIPISQAPDEGAHFWVIDFIRTNLRLPDLADMMKQPDASYYGALSPLSYLPHVLCAFAMPFFNAPLAYRFGSLLMGVVSVLAARSIGKELFPKSRVVALAVPLFLVFHTQLVFVNGYSNNDSASMAVATLAIYASLLLVKRGITARLAVVTGLLGGLLALSKPTTFCMYPVMLAAVVLSFLIHRQSIFTLSKRLSVMSMIAALFALPFLMRNWIVFNGDLLGMRTMLDLWWQTYGKPGQFFHWPVVDNADWRYYAYRSYVANLGNMDKMLPNRIYKLFSLSINIALLGWALSPVIAYFKKSASASDKKVTYAVWLLIVLAFAFNFATLVAGSVSLNATGPPQGRYLFPCEAAIAALIVGGISRFGRIPVLLFIALNVVATALAFNMLYPLWHFDTNIFR